MRGSLDLRAPNLKPVGQHEHEGKFNNINRAEAGAGCGKGHG